MTKWKGPNSVLMPAAEIVNSYGYQISLRQLFYRLVAAGLIPNSNSAYTTLSKTTTELRRDYEFPQLLDNTRAVILPNTWTRPAKALADLAAQYRLDRQAKQEYQIILGAEKRTIETQPAFGSETTTSRSSSWVATHPKPSTKKSSRSSRRTTASRY